MALNKSLKFTAKWILPSMAIVSALLFLDYKSAQTEVKPETKVDTVVESFSNGQVQNIEIKSNSNQERTIAVQSGAKEASFTSTETQAKFTFNGILPEWTQKNVEHESLKLEMRLATKGNWGQWFQINDWEADESKDASDVSKNYSDPVFVDNATAFQYRIGLKALNPNETPEISGLKFTYIDTTKGPKPNSNSVDGVSKASAGAPFKIISRAEWGADPGLMTWAPEYGSGVKKVIIHHTAGPNEYSDGAATVRGIYHFHSVTRGWGDIGYNFLIDKWGNIYEGRYGGDGVTGGHARGYNTNSVGISMMGTYSSVNISGAANDSLTTLAAYKTAQYNIDPIGASNVSGFNPYSNAPETRYTYNIAGHRDYASTDCPGGTLYNSFGGVRQIAAEKKPQYLRNPRLISSNETGRVYLLNNNKKIYIPSPDIFDNYGFVWSEITTISNTQLNTYLDDGELKILAKKATSPEVYLIDAGSRKHIPNPEMLEAYGFNNQGISILEDEIINSIPTGKTLTRLVKGTAPATYYVENGVKEYISSPFVFEKAGFSWNDVVALTNYNINGLKEGKALMLKGVPVKAVNDGKIYLLNNNKKIYIPSPNIFNNYGFSWSGIIIIPQEELSTYPDGGELKPLAKKATSVETYLIDGGNKKYIPNPEMFEAYGFNNQEISILEDEIINNMPIGKELTRLVKGGSPSTYYVENGVKRHILGPSIFNEYGFSWNNIITLSDETISKIKTGSSMLVQGSIVRDASGVKTYYFTNDQLHYISSPEVFDNYGFLEKNVLVIPKADLDTIILGQSLERLINGSDLPIYYVENGKKRHIPDLETFEKLGFLSENVAEVPDAIINILPLGRSMLAPSTIIKLADDVKMYVLDDNNKKRHIPSPDVFNHYGFSSEAVKIVGNDDLAAFQEEKPLTLLAEGIEGRVYLIENGVKRHILGPSIFNEYGFSWSEVIKISNIILRDIPEGDVVGPRAGGIVLSGSTISDITDIYGTTIIEVEAGKKAAVFYSNGEYLVTVNNVFKKSPTYIRFVPRNGGITTVHSYGDTPSWDTSLNDNKFKGLIETRYSATSNAFWAINELPMEDYLKGIAETSSSSPQEHIKTMTVAARSYAYYHVARGGKHAGEPFHLKNSRNGNGDDQQYKGYGLEARFPQLVNAVNQTGGQVVTYGGSPVITPYFSSSDGRTRSAQEKWGWTNTPWLQSVADPDCNGRALSGHGVGLSGYGSVQKATRGEGYQGILSYYFQGTSLGNIGNPLVKVAIYRAQ